MEAEGSSPHLQTTATYAILSQINHVHTAPSTFTACVVPKEKSKSEAIRNVSFYRRLQRWEMLALRQNPKLEGHPLSALHNSLFTYSLLTSIPRGRSSNGKLRTRHAVVKGTQELQHEKGVLTTKPQNTTKHEKSPKRRNKSHTFFENILRNTDSTC